MLSYPPSYHNTPQAISNPDGSFPNKSKSDARKELLQCLTHTGNFTNKSKERGALDQDALDKSQPLGLVRMGPTAFNGWCTAYAQSGDAASGYASIVDGLSIIHKPPIPQAKTFGAWFKHMAASGISTHLRNGSNTVVFLIDRSKDLPPPRSVLHAKRASATIDAAQPPPAVVNMDTKLPTRPELAHWLTVPTFKAALIKSLTEYLRACR